MHPTVKAARAAGAIYLLLGITGPFRLIYIPNALLASKDPATIAGNIAAHETLFRLGMLSDLLTGSLCIFVMLALYRLLKGVDQGLAVLMVILGGPVPAAIYFANALTDAAALMFARGGDFLSVFDRHQLDALAMLFVRLHHQGVVNNEIFWGLWLFPFGLLVFRSGFLPRFLGVWLIIDGCAYLVLSFTGVLLPQYEKMVSNALFPALTGELAVILWLLLRGAKVPMQPAGSPG